MELEQQKEEKKRLPSSHVRFTEREYAQIEKAQRETGLSIPDLLKHAYFKHAHLMRPLFTKEQVEGIMVELRRQGNNLNQITKQINSGLRTGWNQSFNALTKSYVDFRHMISVNRADCKV